MEVELNTLRAGDQDFLAATIAYLNSTGYVNISCHREFDPPIVQVLLPLGLGLTIPYTTYEQIRAAIGFPDDVCQPDNTSG